MKYFFVLSVCLFMFSCDATNKAGQSNLDSLQTDTSTKGKLDSLNSTKIDTSVSSDKSDKTKWDYSEQEDKMTSKKNYYASIDANDLLVFDFPYDGGSTATLTIRHTNEQGNEVLLHVSKGQFVGSIDGQTIKVRFDKDQPISFNTSSASDGSSNVLFINGAKKLIKKLKAAKKVIIQAEFYQSGLKEMEFDVTGFAWNH